MGARPWSPINFIFNRRHTLHGAQPPEVLFQLFDLANQEAEAAVVASEA